MPTVQGAQGDGGAGPGHGGGGAGLASLPPAGEPGNKSVVRAVNGTSRNFLLYEGLLHVESTC